ncbi:hypothetical protein IWW39_003543 [Coemansia spiralis]|uniref:Mos1 transposase HTH domain-containing protein n=1 Tax=Coemansia spiralis TaxID=417178 RepID=A0A9W8GKZ2_9FUNG|nr:hypothetical protein IWW39_003543 [Coemansia spiralis]
MPRHNDFTEAATPQYTHAIQSHIRVFILACFGMQKPPKEALEYINSLDIGLTTTYDTIRQWYIRFEKGDFDLAGHHHSVGDTS